MAAAPVPTAPGAAKLHAFEARLDAEDSATRVLQAWCADHHLADPPVIQAVRAPGPDKRPPGEVRRLLRAEKGERLRYRRVQLVCGEHVLSRADNWYRPALLTPEMNRQLDQTETPFGLVVRPLGFHRRPLGSVQLIPETAAGATSAGRSPGEVLRRRAVLTTARGAPFSYVVETYTSEILAEGKQPLSQ